MYFSCQHFTCSCFICSSGPSRHRPLDELPFVLLFSLCMETQRFCLSLPNFLFFMMSEWNESCTESISYIQVNSSIIKDQKIFILILFFWVLSVFGKPACTQGPSSGRPWEGPALRWRVLQAYCHLDDDKLVLPDSSVRCSFFFKYIYFLIIFLWNSVIAPRWH